MRKKPDAWDLFNSMFKEGEEVVLVDDRDRFHWGKLHLEGNWGCALRRHGQITHRFTWDDVRFIGHDGFPMKKLRGADGSTLIEKLDTKNTQRFIRKALSTLICPSCKRLIQEHNITWWRSCPWCQAPLRLVATLRLAVGDPYFIEDVSGVLFNPSNIWTADNWQYEETLMLYAPDGARGMLWDIPTIYFAEVA